MGSMPLVSVIIPTYNRADSLLRTLRSLGEQSYSHDSFEAIVVDDGSSDNTQEVCERNYSFKLHYRPQAHAGGTQAKNTGALTSQGDMLVFLDDDITVVPQFIECLVREHQSGTRLIVIGTLHSMTDTRGLPVRMARKSEDHNVNCSSIEIPFTDCWGGFFSIRRDEYLELGMLQDPAPGFWPNWEDVDLAYRAYRQGFQFRQSLEAVGYHWDHALYDLDTFCRREERAAYAAVLLFHKHPELSSLIPMFRDKRAISLSTDPPGLILRKVLRSLSSCSPSVWFFQRLAHALGKFSPRSILLVLLYRWLVSAYIYKGYRQGLRELGTGV